MKQLNTTGVVNKRLFYFNKKYKQLKSIGAWEDFKDILYGEELPILEMIFQDGGFERAQREYNISYQAIYERLGKYANYADQIMRGKKEQVMRSRRSGYWAYMSSERQKQKTKNKWDKLEQKEKIYDEKTEVPKETCNKKEESESSNQIIDKLINLYIIKLLKKLQK